MAGEPAAVSVVIPCYNGARFLRATLESALHQTRVPQEILVIDDGSTDDSAAIAESFGPPVRVIRQPNRGESVARNRGIAEAAGTFTLLLDADDLLYPEAIERLLEVNRGDHGTVALMGHDRFRDDPAEVFETRTPEDRPFLPYVLGGCKAPPHCWLFPTEALRSVGGFDESIQVNEDWDLQCRVAIAGYSLATTDFVGSAYRRHEKSQSSMRSDRESAEGAIRILLRNTDALKSEPELLELCSPTLFWTLLGFTRRGQRTGIDPRIMAGAYRALSLLARRGGPAVARTKAGRCVRWFGGRTALSLYGLFGR